MLELLANTQVGTPMLLLQIDCSLLEGWILDGNYLQHPPSLMFSVRVQLPMVK